MVKRYITFIDRGIRTTTQQCVLLILIVGVAFPSTLFGQEPKKKTYNDGVNVNLKERLEIRPFYDLDSSELVLQSLLNQHTERFYQGLNQTKNTFFRQSFERTKKIMDTSLLYKVFHEMPKGALLHTHSGGTTDIDWFINEIQREDDCYVYTREDNQSFIYGQLAFYTPGDVPEGFESVKERIRQDPNFLGELYDLLALTEVGSTDIWVEFEKRFRRTIGVILYRPFFRKYYKKTLTTMLDDNVQHLEIRYIFENLYDFQTESYPMDTTLSDLLTILQEVKREESSFTFNLIYTSLKFFSQQDICDQLIKAFEFSQRFPDFVRGFDLVGEEDRSNPIRNFDACWKMLDSLEDAYGFEMPIYMHAGESNSKHNENLVELMGLRNKRIGHGLNAVLFPQVLKYLNANDILVEINPWSNEILGYVDDLRNHPGRILLHNGVPCAISNDDPGVFGNTGLGYDFLIAYLAWELNLADIKELVYNSIHYSALRPEEKRESLAELDHRWRAFVISMNELLNAQ